MGNPPARGGRREASAAETRQLVVAAALEQFSRSGYARATLNDIATAAGVAVPTVYSSIGGKAMLLEALVRRAFADTDVEETLQAVLGAATGRDVLEAVGRGTRRTTERHWDTATVLLEAAGGDQAAHDLLQEARDQYHRVLTASTRRLLELDALKQGVDAAESVDVLWLFLGLHTWQRLVTDAGWTWDRTERWLVEAAALTLLAP